jgi:hypothetical protein
MNERDTLIAGDRATEAPTRGYRAGTFTLWLLARLPPAPLAHAQLGELPDWLYDLLDLLFGTDW